MRLSCDAQVGSECRNVDMITDATNLNRGATDIVENPRKIGMNLGGYIPIQPMLAVLRAEDRMGGKTGERLRHECGLLDRSLSGRRAFGIITQAVGLGYGILRLWRTGKCPNSKAAASCRTPQRWWLALWSAAACCRFAVWIC